MGFRDVVDQFHDENGFTNASAAEETNLAALWHKDTRRSTTLMPVSRTSASVDCSVKAGASW